jgi:type I restriction enzyme S subunit
MALDDLDESKVSLEFLVYALRNGSLAQAITGTAQPQITRQSLTAISIPVPPLAEQRRIAEVLDRAEALRARRRVALTQLDSLTQSIFLDLFGDPAANLKGWALKRLVELGRVVTGGTPPSAKPGMFEGPIPFVTPGDLESDEPVKRSLTLAGAEESRTVRAGATLVCCIGATIGKMGVARIQSAFNQQLNAIEWSGEVDDLYGYAVLRFFKPTIKAWGASTTLPILKKSSFEKIEIPVPPLPLQREFARRFQASEKLRGANKASLHGLDELFASLQDRAFRGELSG